MIVSRRLVLAYNEGSFSIRNLDNAVTDEGLYKLARALNSVQEDPVKEILKIEKFML